jgi:flagellar biosynthesis protein FlhG
MSTDAAVNISQLPVLGRNVMTIASGKGGVGKTWFAITLAHVLAKRGRKALLFDGDLGLANVDIQLGLMPKSDLASVIVGKLTLAQSVIDVDEVGFSVIAGRSGSGSLALLPPPRGACFVVTTDEPTALTDAYAFIKLTIAERPNADIRIVVNLAESQSAGQKTYDTLLKACKNFLKFEPPLAGVIRRDGKVRQCIQQQKPLLTLYPNCDAAGDVERLARNIQSPP